MSTERDWMERVPEIKASRLRWDHYFLRMALLNTTMSKDPDTRVGAVAVSPDRIIRATGFNGFPRRICDDPERLSTHELKNSLMVHAELNCICHAAREGVSLQGCTLYLAATDDTGEVWGGPPCISCTIHSIQVGIVRVVAPPQKARTRWKANLDTARLLLEEAGVELCEIPLPW